MYKRSDLVASTKILHTNYVRLLLFFFFTQTMHCIVIYNAYRWQSTFKLNHVGSY